MDAFKAAVQVRPEILECHLVAGGFDYLLKTRVADMAAYREFVGSVIWTLPGVRETRTYAVMEEVKNTHRAGDLGLSTQPACERAQARRPKIAVPTRTIVAPSAIAASRSALMPIDSVSSARPSRAQRIEQLAQCAVRPRCAAKSAAGSGIAISPRSRSARQRGHRVRQRRQLRPARRRSCWPRR